LDDVGGRGSDVQLTGRPWQVKQTLDAVLADPRLKTSIDANRIGMIGYSAGGYTTLTTIGGRPDYALWGVHCKEHPEDDELCPADGSWVPPRITRPGWELPPPDPRIKAAVVMAPAGILFDAKGLSGISIPLRIYRARDDHFVRNDWNADHVAALLTNDLDVTSVPGDHFIFIAPCPSELAERYPESCTDAPGIDRAPFMPRSRRSLWISSTATFPHPKPRHQRRAEDDDNSRLRLGFIWPRSEGWGANPFRSRRSSTCSRAMLRW